MLPLADKLEDVLPAEVRGGILLRADAVRWACPRRTVTARRAPDGLRGAFELQAAFALMRAGIAADPRSDPYQQEVIEAFKAGLGFELTKAQRRSAWKPSGHGPDGADEPPPQRRRRIGQDCGGSRVRGDGLPAGFQSVVMAPTEILARQHLHKFRGYLEESFPGLTVELLIRARGAPAPRVRAQPRRALRARGRDHA